MQYPPFLPCLENIFPHFRRTRTAHSPQETQSARLWRFQQTEIVISDHKAPPKRSNVFRVLCRISRSPKNWGIRPIIETPPVYVNVYIHIMCIYNIQHTHIYIVDEKTVSITHFTFSFSCV